MPFYFSELLFSDLMGYFFFDEIMDRYTITGSIFIIIAGLYIAVREYKRPASAKTIILPAASPSIDPNYVELEEAREEEQFLKTQQK